MPPSKSTLPMSTHCVIPQHLKIQSRLLRDMTYGLQSQELEAQLQLSPCIPTYLMPHNANWKTHVTARCPSGQGLSEGNAFWGCVKVFTFDTSQCEWFPTIGNVSAITEIVLHAHVRSIAA